MKQTHFQETKYGFEYGAATVEIGVTPSGRRVHLKSSPKVTVTQ